MSNLRERGFRFTFKRSRPVPYTWVHPADVGSGEDDLTDMDDDEFEAFVLAREEEKGRTP